MDPPTRYPRPAGCLHRIVEAGPGASSGRLLRGGLPRGHAAFPPWKCSRPADTPHLGSRCRLRSTQVFRVHAPVAVAAATLAAAALFSPVRRSVQRRVDRRFNRARYDGDQMVAAFAARLKDAVDLDTVREDLARVVQTALEPAHVSVWTSRRG